MGTTVHEVGPDGESTANWAIKEPGFLGSVKQLLNCARCGEDERNRPDQTRHFRDAFKPTFHYICDACFDALPE